MKPKRLGLFITTAIATILFTIVVAFAVTPTVSVYPGNLQDWQPQTVPGAQPKPAATPTASFEFGPATPPLGRGSAQLSVGSDGSAAAQLLQPDFAGTLLPNPDPLVFPARNEMTLLTYSTFVQVGGSASQAPYIILKVDYDGNGTVDDQLIFEPQYQIAGFCPSNPQGPVAPGVWQTWDAFNGCWYSTGGTAGSGPGANVKTLRTISAAQPNAKIVNASDGGGVRIVAGLGGIVGGGSASDWAGFVGNVDKFQIGAGFDPDTGPNGTIYDFEPKAPPSLASHGVIISEFRNSGPNDPGDQYVELYNTADNDIAVTSEDGSGGWALVKRGATCVDPPVVVAVIPDGTIIPAHGHYLLAGPNYSLGNYPAGDGSTATPEVSAVPNQTLTGDISGDVNLGLFNTQDPTFFDITHRLDAVGFNNGSGDTCDLLSEGNPLPDTRNSTAQYAFVRKQTAGGALQNTNDNATDFFEVSTTPQQNIGDNPTPILGAPGPENTSSPVNSSNGFSFGLTSPSASALQAPNRERNSSSDICSPQGTLKFRRSFTNNSGAPITRLRFRVVDVTTVNSPSLGNATQAVLHVRSSSDETLTGVPGRGNVQVFGLTDEQSSIESPTQCGGVNTSLSDNNITISKPLAPGATIDVAFLLGVEQLGSYRFCVAAEALPSGGSQVFCMTELPPTISKSFGAASIPYNGTTSLNFTIKNPNDYTLSGISFSDTLPSGLTVTDSSSSACGGTLTTNASTGVISLSNGTLAGGGQCMLSVNVKATSAGQKNNTTGRISATETGTGATSNTATLQVIKADQTISFGPLSDKTFGDPDFTVSATASSGLPVSFSASGQCTVTGSTVHITGAGTCTVTASQAGDSNYNAAPDVQRSFNISKASSTTTVTVSNATYDGNPHGATAVVTGAGGLNQSLAVTYTGRNSTTYGPSTTAPTNAGDYTASASYGGDANHNGSSDSRNFQIMKANQTITVNTHAPASATYNTSFTVAATASSGLPVAYTSSGSCTNTGATFTMTSGTGTCSVIYNQAGNANYNAAPQVIETVTAQKASQTISFGSLANKTFGDADFNVSATSSSGLTVSFAATGNCTITGSKVHITGAGSCTITASQAGDTNYSAAADVPQTFQIAKANQTITFGALSNKTYGDAPFTVSATASSGLPVSFSSQTTSICTVSGNTVTLLGAGTCTIRASQTGDSNYNAATPVDQSFTVNKAATTTTVTSSVNPSDFGQSVTFTATVTSTAGKPAGTVQFKDNGANLGNAVTLSSNGVATLSTSTLSAGTHAITADYSGDANFASSTGTLSGGQTVRSQPTLSINDVTVTEGSSGTTNAVFTVTLSSVSNLQVTVNFATADGTAKAGTDYQATSGTLTFNPGETGKTITVSIIGHTLNGQSANFFVNLSNPVNATLSRSQGVGTIQSQASTVQLSSSTYSVAESGLHAVITVNRLGDISNSTSVDYATNDLSGLNPCGQVTGMASQRCDYSISVGTLRFAAGESQKTIFIPIVNDVWVEGPETFTIGLSNATGVSLGSISTATVTINDDDNGVQPNPINDDSFFIRQLYIDFLDREPEPSGLQAWLSILNHCSVPTDCDRIAVALGFVRSPEFQDRGYFIFRFYTTTLGRNPGYFEFISDMARVSGFLNSSELEANKSAFVDQFMSRAEFKNMYDSTLNDPAGYVDKLLNTAGLPNHPTRNTWIVGLTNGSLTRAQVLRQLVESVEVYTKFYNQALIVMQYFGFLRRDPDAAYQTWIDIFNHTDDYRIIVNGFINSPEYPLRFGP